MNLVGDVSGYFTTATTGQYYHPLNSTRILDTRQTTALAANTGITLADPASILANNPTLILNVTTTLEGGNGVLQAYPASAARPTASIVDFISAPQDAANLALVNTATVNSFTIYNASPVATDVVIDTNGYFE